MSTKTVTNQSYQSGNIYNQPSMGVYNQLQPSIGNALQGNINDPYTNMAFNTQLAMGRQSINQQFGSANQALLQRNRALGINSNSPLFQQQLTSLQRGQMGGQANLYQNLLLNASQLRQQSIGMAQNYRPLQTGQSGTSTSTQTQSGLGTWLTPLLSAGLGVATGGGSSLLNMFKPMGGGSGFNQVGSQFGPTGASGSFNALLASQPNATAMNLPQL